MSPSPEEMISWVLDELALWGAEGVSISDLFDVVNTHLSSTSEPPIDGITKDILWKSLVWREGVDILDKKASILKNLAYQDVLGLDFGETKVKIRTPVHSPAANGNLVQDQVQSSQSPIPTISPTHLIQPLDSSLVSSIDDHTAPPAAQASLGLNEAIPRSETTSVQPPASTASKRKGRKPGGIGPKPVKRQTDRRWTAKARHATQEDADREEDARQYEAGLTGVYIDPPGSVRSLGLAGPKPKRGQEMKQKIVVFKSLCLMDPLWLLKNRRSWKMIYNERIAECKASRSAEMSTPTTNVASKEAEAGASRPVEMTLAIPQLSSKMGKDSKASDANSINEDGARSKKHTYLSKSGTTTTESQNPDVDMPILPAVNADVATHHEIVESSFLPQNLSSLFGRYQPDFTTPPSVQHQKQEELPLSQAIPQPLLNQPAAQQPYEAQHDTTQNYGTQHTHRSPMPPLPSILPLPSGSQISDSTDISNEPNSGQYPHQSDTIRNKSKKRAAKPCEECRLGKKKCQIQHGSIACLVCVADKLECSLLSSQPPPSPINEIPRPAPYELFIPQSPPPTSSKYIPNLRTNPPPLVAKRIENPEDIKAVEVAWAIYTVPELRLMCEARKLSFIGLKPILIARLSGALSEDDPPLSIQHFVPQNPTIQHTVVQQPAIQQWAAMPRYGLLARVAPNDRVSYKSPYSSSNTPAKTSTPFAVDLQKSQSKSSVKEAEASKQTEESIRVEASKTPKKRGGHPKNGAKGNTAKNPTDTAPNIDTVSFPQQPATTPTATGPPRSEVVSFPQNTNKLTLTATTETEQPAAAELSQSQSNSVGKETKVPDPKTRRRAKKAAKAKMVNESTQSDPNIDPTPPLRHSAPVPGAYVPSRSQPETSLQNTTEIASIDTMETAPPTPPELGRSQMASEGSALAVENPISAHPNLNSMSPPPKPAPVQRHKVRHKAQPVSPSQEPSQLRQAVVTDTEQTLLEQFQAPSLNAYEVPESVQHSGLSFVHQAYTPDSASPHAAHSPRASLPPAVPNPHPHPLLQAGMQTPIPLWQHDPNQSYMHSHYMASQLSHPHHVQQNPYAYSPSAAAGQPDFGFQTDFPYAGHIQANAYMPMPYGAIPSWDGPLQRPHQPTFYQPQLQGPPLGYFAPPLPQPGYFAPTASTQIASVSNKRKRTSKSVLKPSETFQPIQSPDLEHLVGSEHDNKSYPQVPYKPKLLVELEAMEETLARFSAEAEAIEIPDITARLFTSYDNVVGNLVLSGDKTELTFRALDQEFWEDPLLDLQTLQIIENPILSMKGSRPVELRVKYEDEAEDQVTCRFFVGQSDSAYKAANVMRAAIVTARIVCRAATGQTDTYELFKENTVANIEVVKPFKCETCSKRFKNKEGIKYHREKSNTTCNPNFIPLTKAPKRIRGKTSPKPEKTSTKLARKKAGAIVSIKNTKPADQGGAVVQSIEHDDSSDSDSSSDDSILLWAEKVAFVNPGETVKSAPWTPKKPKPKPSPLLAEDDMLQELVDEVINYTVADETIDITVENVLRDLVEEVVNFTALQEQLFGIHTVTDGKVIGNCVNGNASLDQVNDQRSKDIILNLVHGNFGIFPGEEGLWFAFVAVWLQKHVRSNHLPTSKLFNRALDELVQKKALILTTFPVREHDLMAPTRTIITLPTIEPDGPPIETLRELIRMAYPKCYVPSRFAPPTVVREKLQAFVDGPSILDVAKFPRKRHDYFKLAAVSQEDIAYDSDYEYAFEDDYFVQSEDEEDYEIDSDDSFHDGRPCKTKRADQVSREKQGLRMKSYWAASKAAGSNMLTKTGNYAPIDIESSLETNSISQSPKGDSIDANSSRGRSRFSKPKAKPRGWKGGPIPVQDRERRKIIVANEMLNYVPAVLQNAETGAWDQVPKVKHPQRGLRKPLKHRLPEAITYLQSENGAWDTRAFGHGAPPIQTRPHRRAEGNPQLQNYINRISNSHRPILLPNPKNRQFLPAALSKFLLGTGKHVQPKKRYKKRERREASSVSTSENEGIRLEPERAIRKRKPIAASPEGDGLQSNSKRIRTQLPNPKPQPPLLDDMDLDFHTRAKPANATALVTRKATRGGQELDEIQLLDFFNPRAFSDFEKSPNPGLVSLPISFWAGNLNVLAHPPVDGGRLKSSTVATFTPTPGLEGFEKVTGWEQGPGREMLARRTKAAGYGWINHTIDATETLVDIESIKLKWCDNAAFKIENLPYDDLDDLDDVELVEVAAPLKLPKVTSSKKRQRMLPKKKRVHRIRRLTAWATDFDGVLDNMDSVREEFDVQVAPKLDPLHGRALDGTMSDEEEARLLITVIVVMTLTGGIKETIDWVLVDLIFPKYSINYLQRVWGRTLKSKKVLIHDLTSEFQEAFLSAYETGELPQIDYEHLVDYEWDKVVDWAIKKIYMKSRDNTISLPSSRTEMKKLWDMTEQDAGVTKARETYFDPKAAISRRMESISAIARTVPARAPPAPKNADDIEIDEVTLARSWIKAIIFTPREDYDIEVAQEKMVQLGEDLVGEVRKALIDEKVIMHANKGRAVPGRMYEPADAFFAALRKHVAEQHFVQAVEYKKFLDAEFESGKKFVRTDYITNEGTILCVTNLQAYGRITIKGVNVPMNKFGLTGGGYETRKMSKETFTFKMDIYPTDSYLLDEDIPTLQILDFLEPPRGGEAGEIPIWYGVTDELIPDLWKKVLIAVSGVTALRAGASVESLERIFRPALEEWEIWRLMEWGNEVGLTKRVDESHEGWTMGEWWWAVVGRFC